MCKNLAEWWVWTKEAANGENFPKAKGVATCSEHKEETAYKHGPGYHLRRIRENQVSLGILCEWPES